MQIGQYQAQLVDAGRFRLDGGAMFGVVPRVLWERKKPADEKNRIQMATMLLLLKGEGRVILIDTGLGDKMEQKLRDIYAVDFSEHNLMQSLQRHHVAPEDITDVIITHLHFDHAGGATTQTPGGEVKPTFPNAKYYVQKEQFAWALKPSEKDRASFFQENYIPLQEHNQLILLEGNQELFPGIEVIPLEGHTVAQQAVLIHGEETSLFYAADLIPLSSHVSIPWVMAYDLYPLTTIEEKKRYLKLAVDQNWMVFFEHDPEIYCATVQETPKGFALKEIVEMA